jgi:predicted small metal-binding protein
MRAVDCPCGEHLEGSNDSEVLDAFKGHAADEHEGQYSDTDLRLMVDTGAYDAGSSAGR